MKKPKVSVIVPNYNHALYLRQRLNSIYNQTFQDFEVIILDDCSTDNSKTIIEEYRNKPQTSHIIYSEVNSGSPFKQWAKGFDLAQGEYIWIAESDDWAEPNFLASLIYQSDFNPNLVLLFCNSIWEYPDSNTSTPLTQSDFLINGKSFISKWMLYNNFISNASSVIFKRKTLSNISPIYQDFKGSGDYMFWILLCEQGNVFYTTESLNHFRQHPNSTTAICKKRGTQFKENHSILNYLIEKNYIHFIDKQKIILYYLNLIDDSKNNMDKQTYNECKNIWKLDFIVPIFAHFFQNLKKLVDYIKA